jgi:hypothetical protein
LASLAVNEFLVSGAKSLAVQRSMTLQEESPHIFRSGIDNIAQSRLPSDIGMGNAFDTTQLPNKGDGS